MSQAHYPNIMSAAFGSIWAIMPEKLMAIEQFLSLKARGHMFSDAEISAAANNRAHKLREVKGDVAVLPIYGVLAQKGNMLTEMSGMSSTERLGAEFDEAMAAPSVKAIVLDIDSPGGTIYGIPEFANKIYNARGQGKQIVAVANSLAASAAYWLGAAADSFAVTPSGDAGSIGVYMMHVDQSALNANMGVQPTYISAGKYKVEGNSDSPLSEDGIEAMQASVNEAYDMFVMDVARFRGTTPGRVRNGYGEGRVLSAKQSVEDGLADRVASLEKVLSELNAGGRATAKRPRRAEIDPKETMTLDFSAGQPIIIRSLRHDGTVVHFEPEPAEAKDTGSDIGDRRRRWRNAKRKMDI
jgi:signal peptide peptidase SppA